MDVVLPVFFLAGGEIVLGLVAARIGVWVVRGWRDYQHSSAPAPPRPGGPGGGLRAVAGSGSRAETVDPGVRKAA